MRFLAPPPTAPGRVSLTALLLALASSAPAQPAEENVVELSPFEISAEDYTGYQANTTLAGSRLNSKVGDLASSITIMTPEFFQDIGATNVQDALVFAPNTEAQEYRDVNPDNQAQFNSAQYRVRGFEGGSGGFSRGFFRTQVSADIYNTERLTFNRGPNAILFGSGQVYGIIDNAPKQARYSPLAQLQLRTDDQGSLRGSADVNRVLVEGRLALRVALLAEDERSWKDRAYNRSRRAYLALRADPTPTTTVHANFERVDDDATIVTQYTARETYRAWLAAGRPAYNPAIGGAFPAGTQAAGDNRLVITNVFDPDLPYLLYNRNGTAISRGFSVDGFQIYPAEQDDFFPQSATPFGPNQTRGTQAEIFNLSVEQRVLDSLYLQVAYNREDLEFDTRLGAITPEVYIDVNSHLRDGRTNPFFGQPYFELADHRWNFLPATTNTWRATAAYELDLAEVNAWLGRHRFAVLIEREEAETFHDKFNLRNFTPREFNTLNGTNFNANLVNAQNQIAARQYFVPGDPSTMVANAYGYEYFSAPRNLAPGVNAAWARSLVPNRNLLETDTYGLSMQNYLLKDRLITTAGVRRDDIVQYTVANTRLPDGQFQDPRVDVYDPTPSQDISSDTSSLGAVLKLTPWLAVAYNRSDNLNRPSARVDYFGNTMPSPTGEGEDYGFRVDLLEGRLAANVTWFTTTLVNDELLGNNNAAGGARRRVPDNIVAIQETLNPDVYRSTLTDPGNISSLRDFEAKGVEISVVFNPVRDWRIALNVSRKENVQTNSSKEYLAYLDVYRAEFEANAAIPLLNPSAANNILTVGDALADADRTIEFRLLSDGRRTAAEREWTVNLVTSYDLPKDSPFKGWRVGGTVQWGSAAAVGYYKNADGNFDVNRPIDGSERFEVGAFLRYGRPVWRDRARLSVQVNVRNLFDDRLIPIERVEDRLGEVGPVGNVVTTRYILRSPRTFELSTTLDF